MLCFCSPYLMLLFSLHYLQQLEQFFQLQILFAPCRYIPSLGCDSASIMGTVKHFWLKLPSDMAGAQSGWDTFAVQSSLWGRCGKWCHICGTFQCNPEIWPVSHHFRRCLAVFWQFFVSVFCKHLSWGVRKSLSLSSSSPNQASA